MPMARHFIEKNKITRVESCNIEMDDAERARQRNTGLQSPIFAAYSRKFAQLLAIAGSLHHCLRYRRHPVVYR